MTYAQQKVNIFIYISWDTYVKYLTRVPASATAIHNLKWVKILYIYFENKHLPILMFKHTFCFQ